MADIDKEIAKAKRNAQAKMGRIKSTQKFDVANTEYNPIRGDVSNMNARQKRSYLNQLQKFNSRETQFHIDARGRPLSAKLWNEYKRAEAKANAFVRADIAKYANLYGPEGDKGMTLGEKLAIMRPKIGKLMVNPSGSNMHEIERKSTAVDNEKALRRFIQTQLDKMNPDKQADKLKTGRKQLETMAEAFGDSEMISLAKKLTDEQFKVLWNYTNFATAVSLEYSVYMQSLVSEKSFHANVMENANRKAHEYLEWAGEI